MCRRYLQALAPISAGLAMTTLVLAQTARQPAQQPADQPQQVAPGVNPRVNPNARAAQPVPGADDVNRELQNLQQNQNVQQTPAPGTPEFNRNINRGRTAGGPNDPDTLNRLRSQMSQARSREVTLTGRVFEMESFFMGDLGTLEGTGGRLQGEPISNVPNAPNVANQTVPGAPGSAVNPNRRDPGTPNPSRGGLQQQAPAPQGVAIPQQPGQVGQGMRNNATALTGENAFPQNAQAALVGATNRPFVMVTSQGAVLVEPTSLSAATGTVQGIGELVRVRGQMFERSGLRYLIVTEADQTIGNRDVGQNPNVVNPNQNFQGNPNFQGNVNPDVANPQQAPLAPSPRGERRGR